MPADRGCSSERVARLVRRCLLKGGAVEIDGLGLFRQAEGGAFEFVPRNRPNVFLAYVVEDARAADRLFDDLSGAGFDPWMDRRNLLPGQNWPRSIERAIDMADFFVACFSKRATAKRGHFHCELRYALDCAARVPLDETYIIPVRLDDCRIPAKISKQTQYVDLFPDWDAGIRTIADAVRQQSTRRGMFPVAS